MLLIIEETDETASCRNTDVRFGSLADLLTDFSLTAALEWKAEVKISGNHDFVGPESAKRTIRSQLISNPHTF